MSYSSNTNGKYRGGPPNKAFSTAGVIAIAILGPTAVLASMFLWMNNSSPQARSSDGGKKLDDSRSFFDSRLNWLRGDGSSGGSAKQNAVMAVPVPHKSVHKALDMAFPMEGIRLQKIALQSSVTGDAENWRLCHSADPKVTLCPNASFFAVAQNDGFSDPVVDWLVSAETHVQDLFAAILSTNIKNSCLRSTTPCLATASQFTATEREKLVMLDIGSNHGFYSLMAAATAPWLQVYAFEPQPHCAMYITLALEASGFEEQMFVLNNLAGTKALAAPPKKSKDKGGSMLGRFHVPARSKASVAIPRRTGCRGTFPTMMPDELAAVKLGYAKFPEALETVDVTYVNPSELVPLDYSVLMAKIDVEGFEEEVLDSLDELLRHKRIYNLLIEFNKPQKLRRMNKDPGNLNDPAVIDWTIMLLTRLQGYGYTLVPQWGGYKNQPTLGKSAAAVRTLAESGWSSVDIFAFIPREEASKKTKKSSKGKKIPIKAPVVEEEEENDDAEADDDVEGEEAEDTQ